MTRRSAWLVLLAAFALLTGHVAVGSAAAATSCVEPSGRDFGRAAPEDVGVDSEQLAAALDFAAGRNRLNVQVFRHNCLIGEGPGNAQTGHVPWNVWSVTKSVVSVLTGMASDRGLIELDAPIDRYLPPGLGDAAHRGITVRDLLTETSGMRVGVITEGLTGVVPIDPNSAVQALGVPLEHEPGTTFSYSQRTVDLLTFVLERALGEPLQQFAQRELFDPIGIPRGDYYWARDRSGTTYGYAHLFIPPVDLARIGMLVRNDGRWAGKQLVSTAYLDAARTPSPANSCYGYLFWLGPGCAETPDFLPAGVYTMAGFGGQNVFVLPELDLMVVWTGAYGNVSRYGASGIIQNTTELPHEFFRRLLPALGEPDPGPYVEPPLTTDQSKFIDSTLLLAVFGIGPAAYPGCNVLSCLGAPLAAPFADAPPGCAVLACIGTDPRTPGIR
ncbi:serine hydrolase domain-containing protein [Nocardia sp. NPDC057227]|uniref:serine hydrolase domain-containing protein n=1 Tax=Nocardia sp. NPDC057227 TaxID=3346056 RepID=UPI00362CC51B